MSNPIKVNKFSTIFARQDEHHYHLSLNCRTVKEESAYLKITVADIQKRRLFPCPFCGFEMKAVLRAQPVIKKPAPAVEMVEKPATKPVEKSETPKPKSNVKE